MDLYEQRAALVAKQRSILDKCDEESRDLTSEETQEYEQIEADFASLNEQIEKQEKAREAQEARRKRLEEHEEMLRQPTRGRRSAPQLDNSDEAREERSLYERLMETPAEERRAAMREIVKSYDSRDDLAVARGAFNKFLMKRTATANQRESAWLQNQERAALQMDSDTGGGTLVIPEEFVARLIIGLDEMVQMRGVSTVLPMTSAASLGAPSLPTDPDDADWTVELDTGTLDTSMATGKRMLHPHPVAKRILVSKTLLRRSAISADALVRARLAFKMAVTQEKGFLTGSGSQQPLGIFTASDDGISTGRDYSTDMTTTAITGDGLIGAKYNLLSQYHSSPNLRWMFHRDAISQIRKLKDGNGQYLWQPGLSGDRPSTIIDVPYMVSEFAPNTFTSGLYVGIIGDFSWYWIAESLAMTIQVLMELHAATNQDGYYIRAEVDGMPVLEEAFSRVTLA